MSIRELQIQHILREKPIWKCLLGGPQNGWVGRHCLFTMGLHWRPFFLQSKCAKISKRLSGGSSDLSGDVGRSAPADQGVFLEIRQVEGSGRVPQRRQEPHHWPEVTGRPTHKLHNTNSVRTNGCYASSEPAGTRLYKVTDQLGLKSNLQLRCHGLQRRRHGNGSSSETRTKTLNGPVMGASRLTLDRKMECVRLVPSLQR